MKVASKDTGTASIGMIVERQFCRNRKTTMSTRINASTKVLTTSSIDASTNTELS